MTEPSSHKIFFHLTVPLQHKRQSCSDEAALKKKPTLGKTNLKKVLERRRGVASALAASGKARCCPHGSCCPPLGMGSRMGVPSEIISHPLSHGLSQVARFKSTAPEMEGTHGCHSTPTEAQQLAVASLNFTQAHLCKLGLESPNLGRV